MRRGVMAMRRGVMATLGGEIGPAELPQTTSGWVETGNSWRSVNSSGPVMFEARRETLRFLDVVHGVRELALAVRILATLAGVSRCALRILETLAGVWMSAVRMLHALTGESSVWVSHPLAAASPLWLLPPLAGVSPSAVRALQTFPRALAAAAPACSSGAPAALAPRRAGVSCAADRPRIAARMARPSARIGAGAAVCGAGARAHPGGIACLRPGVGVAGGRAEAGVRVGGIAGGAGAGVCVCGGRAGGVCVRPGGGVLGMCVCGRAAARSGAAWVHSTRRALEGPGMFVANCISFAFGRVRPRVTMCAAPASPARRHGRQLADNAHPHRPTNSAETAATPVPSYVHPRQPEHLPRSHGT